MTPLQELLNWVDQELKLYGYEHKEIMSKILSLKEKEREMVNEAWIDGKMSESGIKNTLNGYDFYDNYKKSDQDLIITRNSELIMNDDTDKKLLEKLHKTRKYSFMFEGIRFFSDREIIGIEPKTYKLIYKN